MPLTEADMIWNRACGDDQLRDLPGDRALANLLRAHGLVMNGGVQHSVECLTPEQLSDAEAGYRYYGFDRVASLLSRARRIESAGYHIEHLEHYEVEFDKEYSQLIPDDEFLADRFEERLKSNPSDFAPLRAKDMVKG